MIREHLTFEDEHLRTGTVKWRMGKITTDHIKICCLSMYQI